MPRKRAAGLGLGLLLIAFAKSAPVDADETSRSYVADTIVQNANGTLHTTETLSIFKRGVRSFVSVSDAGGALVSLPTEFARTARSYRTRRTRA